MSEEYRNPEETEETGETEKGAGTEKTGDEAKKEVSDGASSAKAANVSESHSDDDDYEKVCFICRRPESRAGRLIRMPGNMDICSDCMQKAFNSLQNGSLDRYQESLKNYPGMGMELINLNELGLNSPELPKRQKLKKNTHYVKC